MDLMRLSMKNGFIVSFNVFAILLVGLADQENCFNLFNFMYGVEISKSVAQACITMPRRHQNNPTLGVSLVVRCGRYG